MRSLYSAVALALLATGCAKPHTSQYVAQSCPLPEGARGYPVAVRGEGTGLSPAQLSRIGAAVASHWTDADDRHPPTPEQVMAALDFERGAGSAHRRGKWRPAAEDTATVVLAYRSSADAPTIALSGVRDTTRFDRMVLAAVIAARDASAQAQPQLDTLPLRLLGASPDAPVSIVLRFGTEPAPADGVTRFSLIEENVKPLPSFEAIIYPTSALSMGLEGEVDVSFGIRPDGRPDMPTVHVNRATNPEFRGAVLRGLPALQFHPAQIDCRAVYQLVDEPFFFKGKSRPTVGAMR